MQVIRTYQNCKPSGQTRVQNDAALRQQTFVQTLAQTDTLTTIQKNTETSTETSTQKSKSVFERYVRRATACGRFMMLLGVFLSGAQAQTSYVLRADGTLQQQSAPTGAQGVEKGGSASDAAPKTLPDGMPDIATPVVSSRTNTSPTTQASAASQSNTQPNTSVKPGASIAAPDSTPAARAVAVARDAMINKQWKQLNNLVPQARADVLGIYPEYWALRTQLGAIGMESTKQLLNDFIQKNSGSYLADKLKGEWVLAAARSGNFGTVRELGAIQNSNSQIACAQLEARHMGGQRATGTEAIKLFAPAGACWKLFDQLVADKVLSPAELIVFAQDALENNKPDQARRMAAYIFDTAELAVYDAMMRDPKKWLASQTTARGAMQNEIVAMGLSRLAKTDLTEAESLLRKTWADKLPKQNLQWVYGQFALLSAFNLDSRAQAWYRETAGARLSDNNYAWRVRTALRQAKIDWAWVGQSIDQMSPAQRMDPAWIYWRARSLAASNHPLESQALFAKIADQFNFYGQLAAEELGRPIVLPKRPTPMSEQEMAQARSNLGLQRAVTLFKRGWRTDAVPEWNFALRGMSDRQLMAAAELARNESIYDRVVNTSDKTLKEFDFSQRYIAPFEGRVTAQAKQVDVDPAWVYGLIRQESRFIMDAKSVVGASGLMQLMPATARWVAGKIGLTDFKPHHVNDFDTNTKLGTSYLGMVLSDVGGSQVLASAGYNAGPGRPMLWRSRLGGPVEGAIFAETIPFNETRDYVKHVMSNATYYAAMFTGEPQSLKQRLGQIAPQPYGKSPLP